jgi:hypothetical protein
MRCLTISRQNWDYKASFGQINACGERGSHEGHEGIKITNYKLQTNYKSEITNYKPFFRNVILMISMGQYVKKRGTMVDRE